jgi:hypothetical protein
MIGNRNYTLHYIYNFYIKIIACQVFKYFGKHITTQTFMIIY